MLKENKMFKQEIICLEIIKNCTGLSETEIKKLKEE